jgi:hypothetical protein
VGDGRAPARRPRWCRSWHRSTFLVRGVECAAGSVCIASQRRRCRARGSPLQRRLRAAAPAAFESDGTLRPHPLTLDSSPPNDRCARSLRESRFTVHFYRIVREIVCGGGEVEDMSSMLAGTPLTHPACPRYPAPAPAPPSSSFCLATALPCPATPHAAPHSRLADPLPFAPALPPPRSRIRAQIAKAAASRARTEPAFAVNKMLAVYSSTSATRQQQNCHKRKQ